MEPFDREIAKALADPPPPTGSARLLVVGRGLRKHRPLRTAIKSAGHHCTLIDDPSQAPTAMSRQRFDVVLLELGPDGAGLDWLSRFPKTASSTKTIIFFDHASTSLVVDATRAGAVDFIEKASVGADQIAARVEMAVTKSRLEYQRELRLMRLKKICTELNTARREVADQVDVLCKDLAGAYEDVATQMDDLVIETEFKTLITQELDVEELLRTALEFMLTRTGPTNAAVFLPDMMGSFGLGAYVNYDCPRETIAVLLDHLCHAVCPQMTGEQEIVSFDDAEAFAEWIGIDTGFLGNSEVIAFSCMHHGECMAVVVLFRNKRDPFDGQLASTVDLLRGPFADQLATLIRVHHRASEAWPDEQQPHDDECDFDDYGFGYGGGVAA